MNIDGQLRAFRVVARARTFADAAAELRVSVSAVSQQMKSLERQLDTRLFERVGRRAALTAEGQWLLDAVTGPLETLDTALRQLSGRVRHTGGEVRLGGPRAFGRHWLRSRVPPLLARHPELKPIITFEVPSTLERLLADGRLDLAILTRPPELPGLSTRRLALEEFSAVASPALLKGRRGPRTEEDFRDLRWLVFDRDLAMHAPWWRAHFGKRSPLPDQLACEVAGVDELLAFALEGAGAVVLPSYLTAEALAARLLVLLVPDPPPSRPPRNTLFLAWRADAVETARFCTLRDALLEGALDRPPGK